MERKNILVFGSASSGKSSFIRLLLGKYAIGESRDFYSHHGTISDQLVNVVECPPVRDEQQSGGASYYNSLEKLISSLEGSMQHVVIVVKNNLPHRELECLRQILGGKLHNPGLLSVVVSNWSRQFGRIAERRERGITENIVLSKVKDDVGYALGVSDLTVHFMDTVFWRTEHRNNSVPNTLPTTLQALEELTKVIVRSEEAMVNSSLSAPYSKVIKASTTTAYGGMSSAGGGVGFNAGSKTGGSGYNPGSAQMATGGSGYNPGQRTGYSVDSRASTMTANSGYYATSYNANSTNNGAGYNTGKTGYNPGSAVYNPTSRASSTLTASSGYTPRVAQPQGHPPSGRAPSSFTSDSHLSAARNAGNQFNRGSTMRGSTHGSVTETIDVDEVCSSHSTLTSDDDEEMETRMKTGERWRNQKYQDLSNVDLTNRNEKSTINIPVNKNISLDKNVGTPGSSVYFDRLGTQRAVPVQVIPTYGSESSLDSYSIPIHANTTYHDGNNNNNADRKVELSDVVESKVKELMGREGVVIDMKDNKMTGKIVTKTTIIQEVKNSKGEVEVMENEETNENYFGSELETISNTSFSQADRKPLFHVGQPVRSNTFERKEKEESNKPHTIPIHVEEKRRDIPIKIDQKRTDIYSDQRVGDTRTTYSKISRPPSSVSSSSHSSDETIEVVETIVSHGEEDDMPVRDLSTLYSTIVLLGTEPNLSHIYNFVWNHRAQDVICCVKDSNFKLRYDDLLARLKDGDHLIFIWAVENKTGDFSQEMVLMFADFIEIFSPAAINSMIVVLWHPGSTTDIKASVENMTHLFEQSIEYNTSIGFPVLHFKPIPRFYSTLLDKLLTTPPVKYIEQLQTDCYSPLEPQIKIVPRTGNDSDIAVQNATRTRTSSSSSSSSSAATVEDVNDAAAAGETIDQEVVVTEQQSDKVLVLLSPPGHGKSSVGNLIMGDGHFQVRGTKTSNQKETIQVKSGWMFDQRARITALEFPGLYEDSIDKLAVQQMEAQLRRIGYLTWLVVVWDALEWRNEAFCEKYFVYHLKKGAT